MTAQAGANQRAEAWVSVLKYFVFQRRGSNDPMSLPAPLKNL
jgi:hypothetical protein